MPNPARYFFLFLLFLGGYFPFSTNSLYAQNSFLNRQKTAWLERRLSYPSLDVHSGFLPLNLSGPLTDSLKNAEQERRQRKQYNVWLYRKLKNENLFIVDTNDVYFTIDPLFHFSYGQDLADTTFLKADTTDLVRNTRGFLIRGKLGDKFAFQSSFYENQAYFPRYLDNYVQTYGIVPGEGRVKPFKQTGYDFARVNGYISYTPSAHFNIQVGHGKHFIGEGYRSLLLSDNAFNYPYLRLTTTFGKFQYVNLFTSLQNLERIPFTNSPEANFIRKGGTFHYLNWRPLNWLQLGLFEGVIWQWWSENEGTKPFNYSYVNPVIFANSLIYGLDDKNNAVAGLNLKVNPVNHLVVYGQFALDHFDNSYAWQAGVKTFDLFSIKNLRLQAEFNQVATNTYRHDIPGQSYIHYNQPLAHPSGTNFTEILSIINYNYKDFFISWKMNYIQQHFPGGEIITASTEYINPEYEEVTLIQHGKVGYVINPETNMQLVAGIINRNLTTGFYVEDTRFIYFGLKTALHNYYHDF